MSKNLPADRPGGRGQAPKGSQQVIQTTQAYQGPVPPPEILRELEAIVPGSAKALIETYTTEVAHRQANEVKIVDAEISERRRGQWMAYTIIVIFAIISVCLILLGHGVGGFVTLAVTGIGAAVTLYTGKQQT